MRIGSVVRACFALRLPERVHWLDADDVLVGALEGDDPFQGALLDTYADAHDGVCVADAALTTAGATTVELVGDVAVVVPGSDVGTLPAGARAVVIDLREVSPSADVAAAVSLALGAPIEVGTRRVRRRPSRRSVEHLVTRRCETPYRSPCGNGTMIVLFHETARQAGGGTPCG